jgi:hypothetical protein
MRKSLFKSRERQWKTSEKVKCSRKRDRGKKREKRKR